MPGLPGAGLGRRLVGRLQRVSIGVRLAVLMAGLLVLATGSFGVVSLTQQWGQALVAVEHDSRRLIESLEGTLRVQMLRGDSRLGDAVTRIVQPDGVESVVLAKHGGSVMYATRRDLLGHNLGRDHFACARCHGGGGRPRLTRGVAAHVDRERRVASTAIPIFNAPDCSTSTCHVHPASEKVLGVLQIDVPFHRTARELARYRDRMIWLVLALVVTTSLAVFLLARRWVGRPVSSLLAGTRLVARGDLSRAVPVADGELGDLARAFNEMQRDLHESQRQVVMAEKLASVGRLAASVAHEINNPLTGVLAFAEELRDSTDDGDPRRADYETIHHEAMRCREIVRNLLDFARQEQPSLKLIRLADIVDRTLKLVARLAAFQNVKIEAEVPANLPSILGDAGQLQQVLLDLMVNAAEAMPRGGKLSIRGSVVGECVELVVADTGSGISKAHLGRIFDPFFSTKEGKTSGLGLAVCWSIVEKHQGRISVESGEGEGATFRIALPSGATAAQTQGREDRRTR